MTERITTLTDNVLGRACEMNMRAWYLDTVKSAGGDIFGDDAFRWGFLDDNLAFSGADRVIPFPQRITSDALSSLLVYIHERQKTIWITCGKMITPDSSRQWLKQAGFTYLFSGVGMACDLHRLKTDFALPDNITIAPLTDINIFKVHSHPYIYMGTTDNEAKWRQIRAKFALTQDPERTRIFLAMQGDKPVGVTMLHMAEGVAGIYDVGVLAEMRHQGIASALVSHACRIARDELNYKVAVLQNGQGLIPLYAGVGFKVVTAIDHWSYPESALETAPNPLDADTAKTISLHKEHFLMAMETGRIHDALALLEANPELATIAMNPVTKSTALHAASHDGRAEIVRKLLAMGAPLEIVESEYGCTPILWAIHGAGMHKGADRDHITITRLLIDAGANVNAVNHWGESALDMADHSETLTRLLLENGATMRQQT